MNEEWHMGRQQRRKNRTSSQNELVRTEKLAKEKGMSSEEAKMLLRGKLPPGP